MATVSNGLSDPCCPARVVFVQLFINIMSKINDDDDGFDDRRRIDRITTADEKTVSTLKKLNTGFGNPDARHPITATSPSIPST